MAHGNHDGILANQNINDYNAMQDLITDVPEAKWEENLGRGRGYPAATLGWSGYTYGPPGGDMKSAFPTPAIATGDEVKGPQGNTIKALSVAEEAPQFETVQYGPAAFAQLAPGNNQGQANGSRYSSVLSSLAWMIAGGHDGQQDLGWSDTGAGPGMEATFTNGKQAVSLRIADAPGGVPVASGGATPGYDWDTQYKISNWNGTETAVTDVEGGLEEVQAPLPNGSENTGLRKLNGMKTPGSGGGGGSTDDVSDVSTPSVNPNAARTY